MDPPPFFIYSKIQTEEWVFVFDLVGGLLIEQSCIIWFSFVWSVELFDKWQVKISEIVSANKGDKDFLPEWKGRIVW